jgi:DNA-binding beta-propeller fold protein YncE
MAPHTQPTIGDTLAGYRIDAFVGSGGMGEVYRALDTSLNRNVALKLLVPRLADDEGFRERFLHESRLAASLDHPNVIPVYEAGEAEGRLFIAMRFVEGTDLRQVLDDEHVLESERTLALLAPVAGALDTAHAKGLVHRDVKPANILVAAEPAADPPEHVYLSDFGLTTLSSDPRDAGPFTGTADYAAPELVTGGPVDGRTDVYALGCVLFECLTGEPPFHGDSVMAVLWGHANDPVPSASARNSDLPDGIDDVLRKALAKELADRYSNCRELIEVARHALGVAEPEAKLSRRRLLLFVAASVLAVAAAAVAAVLLTRGGGAAPKQLLPLTGNSLVRIDPATNQLKAAIKMGSNPTRVVVGERDIWVADDGDRTLAQISPEANAVVTTVEWSASAGSLLLEMAFGDGAIWMIHQESTTFQSYSSVWTYDPRTRILRRALRTRNDRDLHGVAVRRGYLWAGTIPSGRTEIVKIQPVTREILWRTPVGIKGSAPQQAALPGNVILLALGQDAVWIAIDHPNSVWRLDTRTGKVLATIKLGFSPAAIAVGETGVWITDPLSDSVVRIDPNTDHVAETFRVGRTPEHLAVGAGSVWTANTRDGTVSRIDPKTFDVKTVDVGGTPEDLAVGLGGTWVVVQPR